MTPTERVLTLRRALWLFLVVPLALWQVVMWSGHTIDDAGITFAYVDTWLHGGGLAFRPGDVLSTRKGLTVEVGNTDAEGRLILADALAEADREQPALLLDAATLTGAARVAVGTDLPALFTPDERLAAELLQAGIDVAEPLWRLPLHPGYRDLLKSPVADLSSTGSKPYAGAITAALFLQRFVEPTTSWAHLDIFAWNEDARPGRTKGGDATALRALFTLIERRYQKS